MPYGIIKVDTITFTDAGVDKSIQISGLVQNPTFSGNVTCTGTISGVTVTGTVGAFTTVSGITVTGTTANFTSGNFTNISGGTYTITSGVFAAGSAASPSISFTGDSNTGLYSPGADQVAISTNGTGRLFVDATGRVGLGPSAVAPDSLIDARHIQNAASTIRVVNTDAGASADCRLIADNGTDLGGIIKRGTGHANAGFVSLLNSSTTAPLTFLTAGSERARIDSSGRVGIGSTAPNTVLDLYRASATDVYITTGNTTASWLTGVAAGGNYNIYSNNAASVVFTTNASERARIDSSGRLLVGTSSARSNFDGNTATPLFQIEGVTAATASASVVRGANDTTGSTFNLGKTRATAVGGNTVVSSGDQIGIVNFQAADGTNLIDAASIQAEVDGTPGTNDMPGRLVFSTTADGASSPTERMRIAQNGVVTIQNGAVAVIGTLTDAATITPDLAADCNFTVTLGGARTIANPTNITAGQSGSIFLVQDGTGGRTASWGSYWDFPGGTAPTLSTAANAVDRVDYIVRSSTSIHTVFTANYS